MTRVLMFCDKLYCEKANERLGGVGKETQIISQEVYSRVDETKFLPIFCDVFEDGSPALPTYLKSRRAIDFSTSEKVNKNWEILIRDLFGKPLYQKPPLGQPPPYITLPDRPSRISASKFLSWHQAANRGSGGAVLLFRQYLDSLIIELRNLYLNETDVDRVEAELEEKLEASAPIRDELLEVFSFWAGEGPSKAADNISSTLEQLLPLKFAPDPLPLGGWLKIATQTLEIFLYELFLRTVGSLLSLQAYETIAVLLKRLYVVPTGERLAWGNLARFTIFYCHSSILDNKNARHRKNRLDLQTDLIKHRCDTSVGAFDSLMQADLLLAVRSIMYQSRQLWWYPRTLIYSPDQVLPLFARAEQRQHFSILCELIDAPNKEALQQRIEEAAQMQMGTIRTGYGPIGLAGLINLERLDTIK